jgi:single-strand DNA-binding protein
MNASSTNTVILQGNLGGDPVEKAGGCVEMRLCTTYGRGVQERTEWHTIKVFGTLGSQCAKFLMRGRRIGVIGRLTYFVTDPTKTLDGTKSTYAEVVADQVDFL